MYIEENLICYELKAYKYPTLRQATITKNMPTEESKQEKSLICADKLCLFEYNRYNVTVNNKVCSIQIQAFKVSGWQLRLGPDLRLAPMGELASLLLDVGSVVRQCDNLMNYCEILSRKRGEVLPKP